MEEVTKTNTRFRSSLGGRNIFTHSWKRWVNPYEILTGDTIDILDYMEFEFYDVSGIRTIRLIRQKAILADGLVFHIG